MIDDITARKIQQEGADALLDAGVRVPLLRLHLPFTKRRFEIRVIMRRPCLSGQILIAKTYLSMGVKSEEMWQFTKEEEMQFLANHGKGISRMVAYMICRSARWRWLLVKPIAWIVRNHMSNEHMLGVLKRFITLMGTDPFIDIIRSAERVNPMKLRLSQEKMRS